MSVEIEVNEGIGPLEPEWDALAERTGASPFLRAGWIDAWCRCFGDQPPTVVCARRAGELAGVIALVRGRRALRSPTNWHTPIFDAIATDAEVHDALAEALLAMRPDLLDLSFVDVDGAGLERYRKAARLAGYSDLIRVIQRSPYVEIAGDWETLVAEVPARRRSKWRRFRRRLEEQGSLTTELERGDRDLDRLLEEGFAVEASGWKGERGTAIVASRGTARFYHEVAGWAAANGWLRLWFLRLDGKVLAFAYCLEHGSAHYELKVGFDPEYGRFGPGVLLTEARLEYSVAAGLASYEFLGQPERHKLDWTDRCREVARYQAFAPTLAGRANRLVWTRGRDLALRARGLRGGG